MEKHKEEGYGVGLQVRHDTLLYNHFTILPEADTMSAQSLYIGIAVAEGTRGELDVGFSSHDGTYSIDFAVTTLQKQNWANGTENSAAQGRSVAIADFLIKQIRGYMEKHLYKFVGAGLTKLVVELSPELPSRLWLELDIVPFVLEASPSQYRLRKAHAQSTTVDEEADSMARKCLLYVLTVTTSSSTISTVFWLEGTMINLALLILIVSLTSTFALRDDSDH